MKDQVALIPEGSVQFQAPQFIQCDEHTVAIDLIASIRLMRSNEHPPDSCRTIEIEMRDGNSKFCLMPDRAAAIKEYVRVAYLLSNPHGILIIPERAKRDQETPE